MYIKFQLKFSLKATPQYFDKLTLKSPRIYHRNYHR
jgi:hypothetical protein